jgi:hypothetical protein
MGMWLEWGYELFRMAAMRTFETLVYCLKQAKGSICSIMQLWHDMIFLLTGEHFAYFTDFSHKRSDPALL